MPLQAPRDARRRGYRLALTDAQRTRFLRACGARATETQLRRREVEGVADRPTRRTKTEPLLCELHAHTTWSDGALSLRELVDLHGRLGFDVLSVTDHTLRNDDLPGSRRGIRRENHAAYLEQIEAEADRARSRYGLLVVPGLELTYNDPNPLLAAHALAIGLRKFVDVDEGLETAMRSAREAGAAIVAAHPFRTERDRLSARNTLRFAHDRGALADLVDRYELLNRGDLFAWVAEAGLPAVAGGDVHRPEHLGGWKTLIPSAKNEEAVVAYLRSERPVDLARLETGTVARLAA